MSSKRGKSSRKKSGRSTSSTGQTKLSATGIPSLPMIQNGGNGDLSTKLAELELVAAGGDDDEISANLRKGKTMMRHMRDFFTNKAEELAYKIVAYGPPYEYDDYLDGALVFECAEAYPKIFNIHQLLNQKADPNIPDKNDLHFYPMHYCARFAHLMVMKMLRKALAKVNVHNELGQSPLSLSVMMKQTPDRRQNQLFMVEYLLKEGADFEIRDKGGFSPLDYAAMNQDYPIVEMLLAAGATVRRDNEVLCTDRVPILDYVTDPRCYTILSKRLHRENAAAQRLTLIRQEARDQLERDQLAEEAYRQRIMLKNMKLEAKRKAREDRKNAELKARREKELLEELDKVGASRSLERHRFGGWEKQTNRFWRWFDKVEAKKKDPSDLYNQARTVMKDLREKNRIETLSKRWKKEAGTRLEVRWDDAKKFDIPGLDSDDDKDKEEQWISQLDGEAPSLDVRDGNDEELIGEDLEDLVKSLGK